MSDPTNPCEIFARTNKEARRHDFVQYQLYADTPNKPGFRSRLIFGERNGAPQISVMTNMDKGPKMVSAGFAPAIWETFVQAFAEIIQGQNGISNKITNLIGDPSVVLDEKAIRDNMPKVPKNTLHFGKNQEGICWLGFEWLIDGEVARIVFKFTSPAWHVFYGGDGLQQPEAEFSKRYARGFMMSLNRALDRFTCRINEPWIPDPTKSKKKPAPTNQTMDFSADSSLF